MQHVVNCAIEKILMHKILAKQLLSSTNNMNLYRGCTHGCIYCDSRSTCYQMNHDFEDVAVKINAPELLEKNLSNKRKRCMIGTGAMCDPYLHIEKELKLTRKCLEIINRYNFGVGVLTKSDLVMRDIDLFESINSKTKAVVQMTLTTFDDELCKKIEPNVCPTSSRIKVLQEMKKAGIPTMVWLDPFLPFINDTQQNIKNLLDVCLFVGVKGIMCFGIGVTLRDGNREYFYNQLDKEFPGLSDCYRKKFGNAYEIWSPSHKELFSLIEKTCTKYNILYKPQDCFDYLNRFEDKKSVQFELF